METRSMKEKRLGTEKPSFEEWRFWKIMDCILNGAFKKKIRWKLI